MAAHNTIDMTGKRIGAWVVLGSADRPASSPNTAGTYWLLQCACGNTEVHQGSKIRAGRLTRGCVQCRGGRHIKRGNCSPTYNSWRAMRARCLRPDDLNYPRYGGRGITICSEWENDFGQFLRDMGERPAHATLDRIDVDGPYSPDNCRWADSITQARNTNHFRLTDEQVLIIRRLLSLGAYERELAALAGVARATISGIRQGRRGTEEEMRASLRLVTADEMAEANPMNPLLAEAAGG